MTDSGTPGEEEAKPSWRRKGGAGQGAGDFERIASGKGPRPSEVEEPDPSESDPVPDAMPANTDLPSDDEPEFEGTLIQTPPASVAASMADDEVEFEGTLIQTPPASAAAPVADDEPEFEGTLIQNPPPSAAGSDADDEAEFEGTLIQNPPPSAAGSDADDEAEFEGTLIQNPPPSAAAPVADDDPEFEGTLVQTPVPGASEPIVVDKTLVDKAPSTWKMPEGLPKIPGVIITRRIGHGGMGVVFEGKQGYLDRRVAVKLLAQGTRSEEFTRRFQREAKILASLSHSNVVGCYQAGVAPDGRCYLAMEFIDGPDLGDWIEENGPLSPDDAVSLCRDMAEALAYAQRSGIIHRDVKPANVLLKTQPHAKPDDSFPYQPMLADLGLARASGEVPTIVDLTAKALTVQGAVMGSPPTMSPEQFDAPDAVDFRTDIYGLGCVFYQCLTGKLAFPQTTLTSLIARKSSAPPPDPRELQRAISPDLGKLVGDMIAQARDDRPASYEELLKRLEGPFRPAPPIPKKVVLGAVAALVLVAGFFGARAFLGGAEAGDERVAGLPPVSDGGDEGTEPIESAGLGTDPIPDPELDPGIEPWETDPLLVKDDPPVDPGTDPTGTGADPTAAGGDAENEGTGAGDPEPEPDPPPVEPPTPGLVLPALAAIQPGETWEFLRDSSATNETDLAEREPLRDWVCTSGSLEDWSSLDATQNGATGAPANGDLSAAERPLPAPPWVFQGDISMMVPRGGARIVPRAGERSVRLALVLHEGQAIMLEHAMVEEEVRFGAFLAHRDAEEVWVRGEELSELSLPALGFKDYRGAIPSRVRISWDGELLTVGWQLAGLEGGAAPRIELTSEELIPLGAPVRLGVELENVVVTLREFVVRGQ